MLSSMARMASDLANSITLWEILTMKITIKFYDMKTLRYLVMKEKFEKMWVIGPYFEWMCVLLSRWRWLGYCFGWVGVRGEVWCIILGRCGWLGVCAAFFWVGGVVRKIFCVEVRRALLWVRQGRWENILGRDGWWVRKGGCTVW